MKRLFILCALLAVFTGASAQNGNSGLDPSFAKGGILIDTTYGISGVQDLKLLPDGRIIVFSSNSVRAYVRRFLQNGTPDSSFGNNGYFRIDPYGRPLSLYASSCHVLPNGKILLGGKTYIMINGANVWGGFLMRLYPNGGIDSSFGNNGIQYKVTANPLLHILPDGRIFAAGVENDNYAVVHRFNQNGLVDSTFGSLGISQIKVYTLSRLHVAGLGIMADGRIAVIGGNTDNVYSVRLDSNGYRDSSLCGTGLCYTVGATYTNDAILYPDGKALVATGALFADNTTFLIRLKADATPDSTFSIDRDGVLTVPGLRTNRLLQMPDGRILCAGYWNEHFAVARVLKDGQGMDTTFGNKGIITINISGAHSERIDAIALQADGKIVAGGGCSIQDQDPRYWNPAAAIVRYLPDAPLGIGKVPYSSIGTLKVYPNPASTLVTVITPVSGTLQLFSTEGRLLRQQSCAGPVQSLDISALPTGTYLLRLLTADNAYGSLFVKE